MFATTVKMQGAVSAAEETLSAVEGTVASQTSCSTHCAGWAMPVTGSDGHCRGSSGSTSAPWNVSATPPVPADASIPAMRAAHSTTVNPRHAPPLAGSTSVHVGVDQAGTRQSRVQGASVPLEK